MPDPDKIRAEARDIERRKIYKPSPEEIERQRAEIIVTDSEGNIDTY